MTSRDDEVRSQAAAWFARLRGPDGDAARTAFATWRDADPRHRAAYERMDARWHLNARLGESRLATGFALRPSVWHRAGLDRPSVWISAVAATLVLMLGSSWWAVTQRDAGGLPVQYASTVGQIRTLSLSDGTRVTLDTASEITELFSQDQRLVRLDHGRARFDVGHNDGRRFVVVAGTARITDQGTVFDVRLDAQGLEVSLLSGQVAVGVNAPHAADVALSSVTLAPGQQVRIAPHQVARAGIVSDTVAPGWVTGMLTFRDAPLRDMLAEINRYSTTQITLGDARSNGLRVTGAFRADAPGDAARNLAALFQLQIRSDAKGNLTLLADGEHRRPAP